MDTAGQVTHKVKESGFGARDYEPAEVRALIYAVERFIAATTDIDPLPPEHMFVPGLYFRCFRMAKNTFLTGKLHSQDDGLIVASGRVTFVTEHETRVLEGPCMVTVKANTKPFLYAHTDVVFYSAHANPDNSTDLIEIENRVITPNAIGVENMEVLG